VKDSVTGILPFGYTYDVTDVRVETHPLKPSGPPTLHGNVETWDPTGKRLYNKHIK
jgi:hypothetical protein